MGSASKGPSSGSLEQPEQLPQEKQQREETPGGDSSSNFTASTTELRASSFKDKLVKFFFLQFIIIRHIWFSVTFVFIYTSIVVGLNFMYPNIFHMPWKTSVVPVLGVVAGLLLVFRTNTSYDRYYEARRLWDKMQTNIRLLTKWIWVIVRVNNVNDMIQKRCAINLCLAFAIASKHYLREEFSYKYEDIQELIKHLPKMFPEPKQSEGRKLERGEAPPTNIPLEISYYIGVYIFSVKKKENWDPATSGMFFSATNCLNECLTGFERIKRTPIPLAYTVHLYHVIWLYILSLPYQLVASLGWWTIPAVCLASFTCSGILAIGSEIEDPFGYDDNDLPLDDMCQLMDSEINAMLGNELPKDEELYLSPHCYPLPDIKINTKEMSTMSVDEIQDLLRVAAANHMKSPKPILKSLSKDMLDQALSKNMIDHTLSMDSGIKSKFNFTTERPYSCIY